MKLLLYLQAIMFVCACAGPGQDKSRKETTGMTETSGPDSIVDPSGAVSPSAASDSMVMAAARSVYQIILATDTIPGRLDIRAIGELNEPLRALAAFYAAMGGTNCDGENCKLTTALGLGGQGSDKHKYLINTYFPDDPVAAAVVAQDCYLRPSGASTFSDFEYLTITSQEDTVKVNYRLMLYNRGGVSHTEGPDVYLLKNNRFSKVERNLWTHVEEISGLQRLTHPDIHRGIEPD